MKKSTLGHGTQVDVSAVCVNNTKKKDSIIIGKNCFIRGVLKVVSSGSITIGNNTYIGGNTVVGSLEKIMIGNNVIIATDVHIYDNNNHPTDPEKRNDMSLSGDYFGPKWQWQESASAPIIVEDNVWIGERSTILKGVTIGKGSIVACNAVVTHDVPEYVIVAGNPAKVVKKIGNSGEK